MQDIDLTDAIIELLDTKIEYMRASTGAIMFRGPGLVVRLFRETEEGLEGIVYDIEEDVLNGSIRTTDGPTLKCTLTSIDGIKEFIALTMSLDHTPTEQDILNFNPEAEVMKSYDDDDIDDTSTNHHHN